MAFLQKCFGGKKQPSATVEDLCHRFSLSQLRKSTNNFDKSRIIGEGGFSVLYRACISINGQLKNIALMRMRPRLREESSSERLSLYKDNIIYRCLVHHPNLVSLVGFCDDRNELIVAHDYAPNGTLYQQLYEKDRNSPTLSWKKMLEISIGVARGLHYLHSGTKRTIIYRGIAPSTIHLDDNWVPKLAFFWLSLKGPKVSAKGAKPLELDQIVGTMGYTAPECFRGTNVTYKIDVFSFGVVLLELICGKRPGQILMEHEVSLRNLAETRNAEVIIDQRLVGEIAEECWELYMNITQSCLSEDPIERPDMGDVEVQLERLLQLQEEADTNRAFFI